MNGYLRNTSNKWNGWEAANLPSFDFIKECGTIEEKGTRRRLMERLLDPMNDWMFKQLFGIEERKDLTIHLINSLLEGRQPRVEDVAFLKVELDSEMTAIRPSIVDVLCKSNDGQEFIVIIQRAPDTYFIPQLLGYSCRVYMDQRAKILGEGGDRGGYNPVRPVVCLAIMKGAIFPNKKEYLSHHALLDVVTRTQDLQKISFTFLELSKFHKSCEEIESDVDKWAYFFQQAAQTSPEAFEEMIQEHTVFSRAYQALQHAAYTPEQYLAYQKFEQK